MTNQELIKAYLAKGGKVTKIADTEQSKHEKAVLEYAKTSQQNAELGLGRYSRA